MIMPFPFTFIFNVPGLMNPFGGIGADSSAGAVSTPTTGHGHSVHSHGHAHAHQAATSVHRPNIPPIANPNGGPAPPYVPHHLGLQSLNQSQSQSQSQSQQSLAQAHLQHQLALHHPSNPSTSSSNLIIRPTRTRVSSRANLPKINRPPPEELERQQLLLHPQDPDVDSLRSLPTNRKRGWEPSFGSRAGDSSKSRAEAEAVVSSTTVSSKTASGYLGQLGRSGPGMGASWSMRGDRQEGEDEQEDEDIPPHKKRRGLAGSILDSAVNAALIGSAVGLVVYRLWRDRGQPVSEQGQGEGYTGQGTGSSTPSTSNSERERERERDAPPPPYSASTTSPLRPSRPSHSTSSVKTTPSTPPSHSKKHTHTPTSASVKQRSVRRRKPVLMGQFGSPGYSRGGSGGGGVRSAPTTGSWRGVPAEFDFDNTSYASSSTISHLSNLNSNPSHPVASSHPNPSHPVPIASNPPLPEPEPEPKEEEFDEEEEEDQMDWISTQLSQLIKQGQQALGREVVVSAENEEDERGDGEGWVEDTGEEGGGKKNRSRAGSVRRKREGMGMGYETPRRRPHGHGHGHGRGLSYDGLGVPSSAPPTSSMQPGAGYGYGYGSSMNSNTFSRSTTSLVSAGNLNLNSGLSYGGAGGGFGTPGSGFGTPTPTANPNASAEDLSAFESPELRESMERARARVMWGRRGGAVGGS